MPRRVALLRGINFRGHRVGMAELRRSFESLGFKNVETVLASGNVVFDAQHGDDAELEESIQRHLERTLGFTVTTLVRSVHELEAVVDSQPFDLAHARPRSVVYVVFVRKDPSAALRRAVLGFSTAGNEVSVGRRVVYWLVDTPGTESNAFGAKLLKALGSESTGRSLGTIRRIVERYR